MQRILSGVRPTGSIHLGNYLGAIRHWVAMQHVAKESFFCVVDLHALTTLGEDADLAHNTRMIAAAYIASGIDPHQVFAQSHVPEHTELCWYLSCLAPMGWLNRMTQFKEKAGKHKENACLGLYAYPVLQAADVLIYKATHVPIGEDQKQHLELARDLAGAFNRHVSAEFFPLPEPMILGEATRVMSLRDGTSKMSKSDASDYSRIHLTDDADTIALKIRKAKTDTDLLPETVDELTDRPEALNLLTIYAAMTNQTAKDACPRFSGQSFAVLKKDLTDALIAGITPIGAEMSRLLADPAQMDQILHQGGERARAIATSTIRDVRQLLGLLS